MCTLIVGRDVLGPGSLLVGANRDEDPGRSSTPPARLSAAPDVIAGRDGRAGGTWLAVRDAQAVVAVLNRRGAAPAGALRSRGLLALDVAGASGDGAAFADVALAAATASLSAHAYAPFALVCVTPHGGWLLAHDGGGDTVLRAIDSGWHVLTHAELDDAAEPRTQRLARKLAGYAPATTGEAETRVLELLSLHGSFGDGAPPESPAADEPAQPVDQAAVCIHAGRMVTVSTSLFRWVDGRARLLHIEGRPCTTPPRDLTPLFG